MVGLCIDQMAFCGKFSFCLAVILLAAASTIGQNDTTDLADVTTTTDTPITEITSTEPPTDPPTTEPEPTSTSPDSTTTPAEDPTTTPSSPETTEPPTTAPSSTSTSSTTTKKPEHHHRNFNAPSFIGGMVLALGLVGIGYLGFKFYKSRMDRSYHTL